MNTATLSSPSRGVMTDPQESIGQAIRRFTKMAATIALVFAIAAGGWLVMSQMPGGGGRFAAFQGTSEDSAQTCGVEPLTIDRVMDIVKNPYPFMANGATGEPTEPENPDNPYFTESRTSGWWDLALIGIGPRNAPEPDKFEQSSEIANAYINCVVYGTVGQIWTYYSPTYIQKLVLDRFPVFATEDEVRAYVTERIAAPADEEMTGEKYFRDAIYSPDAARFSVNSDPQLALQQRMWGPYESMITFGVQVDDANGNTIFLTNASGSVLIRHPGGNSSSLTITIGLDAFYGNLVVFPYTPLVLNN